MRKRIRNFDWKGRVETLEDRRVMSADSLLGGSIEHHALSTDAPQVEHQLVSEPDFWLNPDDIINLEDQLDRIEQTLSSAHNTTGLNSVVANYGLTGVGQTVAVIDSGIAYDHYALGGGFGSNYKVVGGWDFSEEYDANPYDDGPSGSHGTHVAGIVGGTAGPDKGVAPGVDLVALRVFNDAGDGYFSWVENALQWVIQNRTTFENPITAINLSLGVSSWNSNTIPGWSSLEDEFATLKAAGVFIAVSAGNSFATYNAPGLSYPAASPNVVPVMSVTDGGALASYSQRDTRAIAAPGSAIRSTIPDYKGNNNGTTDDYANFSGTSMASPYIAGASVLIRQAMEFAGYTNITQDKIYNHMMSTATSFVDSVTGLTFKRLNLSAAIDALMPADEYGSTVATAQNMGSLLGTKSYDGKIGTLSDVDYFKFTASASGRVTFAASDITHEMIAKWELSGGTGTLSNNGKTFSFDVVAGQTYTVGLSSSGGIGHYHLDVSAQNSFSYTDWGSVSFSQLNNLAVSGQAWYRVTASRTGYLTVEGLFNAQSGQVSLQLYNSNMQVLASGNSANGSSRVDTYATAGQQFYVCVSGTNSNVNYRLSNLVSVTGTTVNVAGTSGDDTLAFTAGGTHTVTVNGVAHSFSSLAVNTFNFDGGSGADTITMTGTAGDETATLRVGTATLVGPGYSVATTSVEYAIVNGGSGNDTANLYDSAGNDTYGAWLNQAYIYGNAYKNEVRGFESTLTQSTLGGYDQATFYDTAGNDSYVAWFNQTYMYGSGYKNEVRGFDRSLAQANSGGDDQATFYDTAGNDVYGAWANQAYMYGTGYWNEARGFDRSIAHATSGGYDQATFYDTAGNDSYVAWFNQAYMYGTGYRNEARGFDITIAQAASGGDDQADFYDTADDDIYGAWFNQAYMLGNSYRNEARGFDRTIAHATLGGNDLAAFYDTAGNDTYVARLNQAYMYGSNYRNEALGFSRTTALAVSGGDDQAELYDTASDDTFVAWFNQAYMYAAGYRNDVRGFERTYAHATSGGIDQAVFYDTVGDDVYAAWSNRAVMSGLGYVNEALKFERTIAHAVAGGVDRAEFYDSIRDDVYSSWSNRAVMYGGSYLNDARNFEITTAESTAGGNDKAIFCDSSGDDMLIARAWGVSLAGQNYYNQARYFNQVTAQLINGGNNVVDADLVDYIFDLVGQWN
jgi:subtilisin family serine protease